MDKLSFYIVSDAHYFSPRLKAYGRKYEEYMDREQKCLAESGAINEALFDKIARDNDTDIVIIPGDLTKNGEKKSHEDFLKVINRLKESGKKIFLITAGHDYNDRPIEYDGDNVNPIEGTKRAELMSMYADYGYREALSVDEKTMSYVAQIRNDIRMLALNCDGEGGEKGEGYFDSRQLEWARKQIEAAKNDGCKIFAINHYPIIPGCPAFDFIRDAKIRDWEKIASFLADNGVKVIFTGHMHNQSVKCFTSEKGNKLYDICTSSVTGYPGRYRKATYDGNTLNIESFDIPDFDWNGKKINAVDCLEKQFERMINNVLTSNLSGGNGFAGFAKKCALHFINAATVASIGRLLFIKPDKSIKDISVRQLAVNVVKNIFAGDAPYGKDAATGDFFERALDRCRPILKKFDGGTNSDGKPMNIREVILNTIGNNTGIEDNNTTIIL